MLSLDIPEVDSDSEVTKKLEAFEIHDGDRIRVFPIAPYNQDAVYLEGHVIRPGRYSYRQGDARDRRDYVLQGLVAGAGDGNMRKSFA